MSFDIRLINGDLELNGSGDFTRVLDTDKLVQDVIKGLNTVLGEDIFKPNFGTELTSLQIGQVTSEQLLTTQVESSVRNLIRLMIRYQNEQRLRGQQVSVPEQIVDVGFVRATIDTVDPRQVNIEVEVLTGNSTPITFQFSVGINITSNNVLTNATLLR